MNSEARKQEEVTRNEIESARKQEEVARNEFRST